MTTLPILPIPPTLRIACNLWLLDVPKEQAVDYAEFLEILEETEGGIASLDEDE